MTAASPVQALIHLYAKTLVYEEIIIVSRTKAGSRFTITEVGRPIGNEILRVERNRRHFRSGRGGFPVPRHLAATRYTTPITPSIRRHKALDDSGALHRTMYHILRSGKYVFENNYTNMYGRRRTRPYNPSRPLPYPTVRLARSSFVATRALQPDSGRHHYRLTTSCFVRAHHPNSTSGETHGSVAVPLLATAVRISLQGQSFFVFHRRSSPRRFSIPLRYTQRGT